jgi:hypothetical protein
LYITIILGIAESMSQYVLGTLYYSLLRLYQCQSVLPQKPIYNTSNMNIPIIIIANGTRIS